MRYTTKTAVRNPMGAPGLEYGDLESIHSEETYEEIKDRRESNYNILKKLLETGEPIYLENDRLEVFVGTSPIKASVINLIGAGKDTCQIITYPFTPSKTDRIFLEPDYGHTHTIRDVTIKAPTKNYLFETYDCILKPNGDADAIQITSEVREEFFGEISPGSEVFINWTFSVQGQAKIVDSIDEQNGLIVLTTNISDDVESDTVGKFGTPF